MTLYANWRDVPASAWRWPNFSPREIACKGTGRVLVNEDALDRLQALRDDLGVPLIVRSAYRSPEHNASVGGARRSLHMQGIAFDIAMSNHNPSAFDAAARKAGFTGFGTYPRSGFMHIDTGPARSWGEPFAMTDTNLPPEPPIRPESVKEDRDVQVVGGAGALAIAAELLKPDAQGATLLDRLTGVEPITLIILAAAGFLIWRHMRGSPK